MKQAYIPLIVKVLRNKFPASHRQKSTQRICAPQGSTLILGSPRPIRLGGEELEDSGVWELHAMTRDNLEKKLQLLLVPN